MFHFTLFPEKNKEFFFQKTPLFLAHCAHFWPKQNAPLNSVPPILFNSDYISLCQILKKK